MLLSFDRTIVGAFVFPSTRGHAAALYGSGVSSPAGVEEHEQTDNWGSPGTWEILSSPRKIPGRSYRVTNSRPRWWHSSAEERKKTSDNRGTTKRRQRSAVGGAAGSHSALIRPTKLANGPQPEPLEESEAPDHGTVFEKHDECLEIRQTCPRNRNG